MTSRELPRRAETQTLTSRERLPFTWHSQVKGQFARTTACEDRTRPLSRGMGLRSRPVLRIIAASFYLIRAATVRERCCWVAQLMLLGALIPITPATAEQVQLIGGAVIEGELLDDSPEAVQLVTPSGELVVPRGVISRVLPEPSRWKRYEEQVAQEPLSAARHLEIARWCESNGLPHRRAEHIAAALEQDPTSPEALAEAGYVQVGDVWMKATNPPSQEELEQRDAAVKAEQDRIIAQLLKGWVLRVRSIREAYLKGGPDRDDDPPSFKEGRSRVLELDEPLALAAICSVLSDHNVRSRRLLVEALADSNADVAVLNLLALAILDADDAVRDDAIEALVYMSDERVSAALRSLLGCRADSVVRRAAVALGAMRDRSAVPELIDALIAQTPSQEAPDAVALLEEAAKTFDKPIPVALGEEGAAYPCRLEVTLPTKGPARRTLNKQVRRGTQRTEVQDALIAITGQNHGFDTNAWKTWLRENPPQPAAGP